MQFRLDFLRVAEEIQRELCSPSFPLTFESEEAIALSLTLDGTKVEFTHSLAVDPASVCIDIELDPIPDGAVDLFEVQALLATTELFRTSQASIGVGPDARSLSCSLRRRLACRAST